MCVLYLVHESFAGLPSRSFSLLLCCNFFRISFSVHFIVYTVYIFMFVFILFFVASNLISLSSFKLYFEFYFSLVCLCILFTIELDFYLTWSILRVVRGTYNFLRLFFFISFFPRFPLFLVNLLLFMFPAQLCHRFHLFGCREYANCILAFVDHGLSFFFLSVRFSVYLLIFMQT